MNKRQLREIVKQDNARRAKREAVEDAILGLDKASNCPDGIDPYHWGRSITGIPENHNRNCKASDDCWKRGMRGNTVGVAPGTENSTTGWATVAVTRDGETTVVPVSNYRTPRKARTARTRTTAQTKDSRTTAAITGVTEASQIRLQGMDWSQ